jgi:general secretion pathway protein C
MTSSKQIITALNVCFIPVVVYFGIMGGYKFLMARLDIADVPAASRSASVNDAGEIRRPLGAYDSIGNRNLFDTPDKAAEPVPESKPPQDIEKLEHTGLKLKLWGTVTGDADKAYAVIEETTKKKQELYRIGDPLDQSAVVKEIHRERIILTVNGQDQILAMEKKEAGAGPAPGAYQPPSPEVSSVSPPENPLAAPDSSDAPSSRISLQREQIADAINNVNSLMQQARIRPHFKDGKPDGLTFSRVQQDSIFSKLGLQSGDIITGVNGSPIESVDDALGFYNSLKTETNVKLQIRRRGKDQLIDYSIE